MKRGHVELAETLAQLIDIGQLAFELLNKPDNIPNLALISLYTM